jgi:hypothetical protein
VKSLLRTLLDTLLFALLVFGVWAIGAAFLWYFHFRF